MNRRLRRETVVIAVTVSLAASIAAAGGVPVRERLLRALDTLSPDRVLLEEAARSPDPAVRRLAVRVLSAVADPGLVGELERFARDRAVSVRREAQLAAGRTGCAAAGIVTRGLGDRDGGVRAAAVRAAGFLGDRAPHAVLRLLRSARDPRVLAAFGEALPSFPEEWRPRIAATLEGQPNPAVVRALAAGAGRWGGDHALLRKLARSDDPEVRAQAVLGLGRGDAQPGDRKVVFEALADREAAVRVAAASTVARRGDWRLGPAEAGAVALAAGDPALHVRVMAIRVLGRHPEAGGHTLLERLVAGPERWPAAEALEALARRGEAGGLVDRWLGSGERWRREAAARCVAMAGAVSGAPDRRVLGDSEPSVRLAWIEALPAARRKAVTADLRRLLETDPDPIVRAAALDALCEEGAIGRETLLGLARRWAGDDPPDARAAALVEALHASGGRPERLEVLRIAREDPSPLVGTLVVSAARAMGLTAAFPARRAEAGAWYRDVVAWARRPCWIDLVTIRGTVRLRLEAERAPLTCRRIRDLAADGFYDGLTFHRVVPDFVVQGGDPRGDGWGSGGVVLPDEPSAAPFERGAVGIATSGPNTGGCQFFAMLLGAPHLDGRYTRFARVVAGRDVLDRIGRWDTIRRAVVYEGEEPAPPVPVLVGPLEPADVLALSGWREAFDSYAPDPAAMERLEDALERGAWLEIGVVLGTWCSDSAREVPRLLRIVDDVAGTGGIMLRIEGVDRTMIVQDPAWDPAVLPGRVADRVPEIIVGGPGGELARVVETAPEPLEVILARAADAVLGEVGHE